MQEPRALARGRRHGSLRITSWIQDCCAEQEDLWMKKAHLWDPSTGSPYLCCFPPKWPLEWHLSALQVIWYIIFWYIMYAFWTMYVGFSAYWLSVPALPSWTDLGVWVCWNFPSTVNYILSFLFFFLATDSRFWLWCFLGVVFGSGLWAGQAWPEFKDWRHMELHGVCFLILLLILIFYLPFSTYEMMLNIALFGLNCFGVFELWFIYFWCILWPM